ncbi:MAG: hypothetical protein PHU82_01130 [Candidatus Pacebacteria bacterium]|jgi:hypothetical protein|nr:hypothetical protein [Candidatus Paceibacterota bacterium]MDD4994631.1 hypothetical protein [Candidatus Paceibacterota bacterium]MDD5535353.1 hypothetical protein [Candidatus Paceibacterota bacterium]
MIKKNILRMIRTKESNNLIALKKIRMIKREIQNEKNKLEEKKEKEKK